MECNLHRGLDRASVIELIASLNLLRSMPTWHCRPWGWALEKMRNLSRIVATSLPPVVVTIMELSRDGE